MILRTLALSLPPEGQGGEENEETAPAIPQAWQSISSRPWY